MRGLLMGASLILLSGSAWAVSVCPTGVCSQVGMDSSGVVSATTFYGNTGSFGNVNATGTITGTVASVSTLYVNGSSVTAGGSGIPACSVGDTLVYGSSGLLCSSDAYLTRFLFHFDGANNSTVFTDSSLTPHPVSIGAGSPVISMAQSKFGGASLYLNGGSRIAFTNNIALGTSDFTLEWWQYQTSQSAYAGPFHSDSGASQFSSSKFYMTEGVYGVGFLVGDGGSSWAVNLAGALSSLNVWHHVALVRSGSSWKYFLDGTLVSSATSSVNMAAPTGLFSIGWAGSSDSYFYGYIDEMRLSVGVALYSSTFTPPTTAFINP